MKKVLFWDTSVAKLLGGEVFGGIAVQLKLWMDMFNSAGCEVNALTYSENFEIDQVKFHKIQHHPNLEIISEWKTIYEVLQKLHPELIIVRGAQRTLYPLTVIGHHFRSKVLFFGASDLNFQKGQTNSGNRLNGILYEKALGRIDYIVTQNSFQHDTLMSNFGIDSRIIPNIWRVSDIPDSVKKYDAIWVSNFRELKRPEWFIAIAKLNPHLRFAMIGGAIQKMYFDCIYHESKDLKNLDFLGPKSFTETSSLIGASKVLICTSVHEGFPNTFLQAWANQIPVISTVDPNRAISNNNLGIVGSSINSLSAALLELIEDTEKYQKIKSSISDYFYINHSATNLFETIKEYIGLNE